MKALSIRNPWASLIVAGIKDIENRTWITHYRGPLLIHVSQRFDKAGLEMMGKMGLPENFIESMRGYSGGIIGQVELVDVVKKSKSPWFEGPYGFVLKNAKILPFKPSLGKLGIYDYEA